MYKWLLGAVTAAFSFIPNTVYGSCVGYCGRCPGGCVWAPFILLWPMAAALLGKAKELKVSHEK